MGGKSNKAGGKIPRWALFAILLAATIFGVQAVRLLPAFVATDTALGSALIKALSGSIDDEAVPDEASRTDMAESPTAATPEPSVSFDRAVSYYKGIGVEKDYRQALGWYLQASREGFPVGKYRLSQWDVREGADQSEAGSEVPPKVAVNQAELPVVEEPLGSLDRAAILRLQSTLSRLGYDPGPIDGILGPKTRAAFERSQEVEAYRRGAPSQPGERVDS